MLEFVQQQVVAAVPIVAASSPPATVSGARCSCCGFVATAALPFRDTFGMEHEICPICGSWSRHRIVCHVLDTYLSEPPMVATRRALAGNATERVLHFAPEPFVMPHVKAAFPALREYVTADLNGNEGRTDTSNIVVKRIDVSAIPERAGSFDGVIAVHVLEHVPNDRLALRELSRVLKPGGWGILSVPVTNPSLNETFEDKRIVDAAGRLRAFGQADHVRAYTAHDFRRRATAAGLRCCPFATLDDSFFDASSGALTGFNTWERVREKDLFCRKPPRVTETPQSLPTANGATGCRHGRWKFSELRG